MTQKSNRIPLFYFVTTMYWFSLYTYVPTLSTYAESLGATYKMIGLIVGSYGFVQMLLRIPLGILSDTLKKRKIFVSIGVFLGLASCLGMWLFPKPEWLLVFRSMAGASAATWVTYTVLFSSYFDEQKAPAAMGIINAITAFGQMVAMFLGGIMSESLGANAPFLLGALGGAVGLVASAGVVEKEIVQREPLKIRSLLEVGTDAQLLVVSVLAIVVQILVFGTVYGFTPVAAKAIGASDFELGMLTTIASLPVIFSSALSGSLFTRYLGERKTIILGFIITGLSCIAVPYCGNIYLLYISQFIGGFGRGLSFPILMGLSIKHITGEKRATAMGFFQAIYGLGMFLGPVIVGFLSDYVGLTLGFWATGFIGFLGAVLTAVLIRRSSSSQPQALEKQI